MADCDAPAQTLAQAQAVEHCIQQQINDNIADLPMFYGRPEKDTLTLKYYISHVDQSVPTLHWT